MGRPEPRPHRRQSSASVSSGPERDAQGRCLNPQRESGPHRTPRPQSRTFHHHCARCEHHEFPACLRQSPRTAPSLAGPSRRPWLRQPRVWSTYSLLILLASCDGNGNWPPEQRSCAPQTCGATACKRAAGASCEVPTDCQSNVCIRNVCCSTPCDSTNATATCEPGTGECILECEFGWGDCDGNLGNGCETSLINNPDHCGTCGEDWSFCSVGICQGLSCRCL